MMWPMRRAVLPLPLVLLTAGSLIAHELSYRLVAPGAHGRADLLEATGHAYLRHAPATLGLLLALLPVCLAVHACSRGGSGRPPGRLFIVLPVLGFAGQEHAERWAATGAPPVDAALEPTFLLGVVLQVPFALAALLATRLLLRVADRVAACIRGRRRPAGRVLRRSAARLGPPPDPRGRTASAGRSPRGPPWLSQPVS